MGRLDRPTAVLQEVGRAMKFSAPLKSSRDFRRLYAKGKSASSQYAVVYCRKNRSGFNRIGITVGAKVGKAVHRNKIRRRYREIYRLNEDKFRPGYDIVAVVRAKSREAGYWELEADFLNLCRKLGICDEDRRQE